MLSVETPYLITAPADPLNGLGLHHNGGVRGHRAGATGENRLRRNVPLTPHLPHFPPLLEIISHTRLSKENQYALAKFKTKATH